MLHDFAPPESRLLLLALVVGGAAIAAFAVLALGHFARLVLRKRGGTVEHDVAHRLPLPVAILVGTLIAGLLLQRLSGAVDPDFTLTLRRILVVVFVLVGAWGVLRIVRVILGRIGKSRERFQPAARVTSRIFAVLLYALAFLTILAQYGISITPLLTGLGLAALAVGLALQETLSNFFAGLWIQTEQPLSPGHYVRLEGQNIEGFVERVGWRTTRIRALPGNLIIVPNSKVAQAVVTDFTMPDPTMSVVMNFRLPFDVDPNRAMTILVEEAKAAAKAFPGLLEEPAPFANATPGIGEYGITYSLIIKVRQFVDQWNAQTAVTARVWARLAKEGIRIPYPTRINLQASGEEFAPNPTVRAPRKASKAPEGKDPREIEAEQAQQAIAARVAADAAKGKVPPQVAADVSKATGQPAPAAAAAAATSATPAAAGGAPADAAANSQGEPGGQAPEGP